MMKKANFLLLLLALVVACKEAPRVETPPMTAEELRLARCGSVDSVMPRLAVSLRAVEGYAALDTISAEAWLLVDDATGWVISQKNAAQRMYMASLTKMMTCLVALENGKMADSIDILRADIVTHDSRVRPGQSYTLRNLLYEMMLLSDNDAAYAVARHVGGDSLGFYRMMNEKAAYLGMGDTHFDNPNGMPNDSNYSSARDLMRLVRYAMADSTFAAMVGTADMDVPLTDGRHLPCHNTNALLGTYDGCIGVKTGFTRQAGCCLASAARRGGTTLVLVLLKSTSMPRRFSESAALLDYGFRVMEAADLHSAITGK